MQMESEVPALMDHRPIVATPLPSRKRPVAAPAIMPTVTKGSAFGVI
jgi:hypothetical protein